MTVHVTWMPCFAPTVALNLSAICWSSVSSSVPEDQPENVTSVTFCVLCPAWADAATRATANISRPRITAKRFVMSDDPPSLWEPVSKNGGQLTTLLSRLLHHCSFSRTRVGLP